MWEIKNTLGNFGKNLFRTVVVFGVIFVSAAFCISGTALRRDAELNLRDTVAQLRRQCVSYDRLLQSDRAKSLIRLTEQAESLRFFLSELSGTLSESELALFAKTQSLSGVVLLDEGMEPECEYSEGRLSYADWRDEIIDKKLSDVGKYKGKIYSERVMKKGGCYDMALVSREDSDGIICCYKYQETDVMTANAELYENIMTGYEINHGGTVYITENGVIQETNGDFDDEKSFAEKAEQLSVGNKPELLRTSDGMFLGMSAVYKEYKLYAFIPAESFSRPCIAITLLFAGAYIILALLVLIVKYRMDEKHILEVRDKLRIIRSISGIYSLSILVNVDENSFSIISAPPHISALAAHDASAADFFGEIGKYVFEQYSGIYAELTEPDKTDKLLEKREYAEFIIQDVSGIWFRNIVIANERRYDGHVQSFILVSRNIDEQKKRELENHEKLIRTMEEATRANNAKTDFLRRMSHDIRTPINVIMGMVALGNRFPQDAEKQRYCRDKVRSATSYLLELVNDVLMVNRIDAGVFELEKKSFGLRGVVSEVCGITETQAAEKGISFKYDEIHNFRLIGSPLHLRQILMNVLGNAVKYTPRGGSVELLCHGQPTEDGRVLVRFTCRDTGIGMSKEFQKHMFEPFAQERPDDTAAFSGIGLGLPIVRMLTDKMGGTVSVISEVNEGTCFVIEMPFDADCSPIEESEKKTMSQKEKALEGLNIMIAEDNALNMDIVKFMLEDMGARVICAANGDDAVGIWESAEENSIDAILMDLMMPEMDGFEAARRIRGSEKKDADKVIIIAVSANAFDEDGSKSRESGLNAYLLKPFDADRLAAVILNELNELNEKGETDDAE